VKYSSNLDFIKILIENPESWSKTKDYVHQEIIIDFPYLVGRNSEIFWGSK